MARNEAITPREKPRVWVWVLAPLFLLMAVAGCKKDGASEKILVELRVIMLTEEDPENQPATDANRAMAHLAALHYDELRSLAEISSDQEVLQKLESNQNFNIIDLIRRVHAANNDQVWDVLLRLSELPLGKAGGATEPLSARVIVMALQALG